MADESILCDEETFKGKAGSSDRTDGDRPGPRTRELIFGDERRKALKGIPGLTRVYSVEVSVPHALAPLPPQPDPIIHRDYTRALDSLVEGTGPLAGWKSIG